MTQRAVVGLALALWGCSIILSPDRDAIAPDLDAAVEGAPDVGPDGAPPGPSCRPTQAIETVCEGGKDEDCDGQIDCSDTDCRGAVECCRGRGDVESVCLQSLTHWRRLPLGTNEIAFERSCPGTRITSFGIDGIPRALMSTECQPIGFGMRFEVLFVLRTPCGLPPCDYAALSLTPVATLVQGEPLLSELRGVVYADGSAAIERAGTVLARTDPNTFTVSMPIRLRLTLEPGPDETGRDVLFASASFQQGGVNAALLARTPIVPLADLRCLGGTGRAPGLYAALEGAGEGVLVEGPLARTELQCSNPSQFRPQELVDTSAVEVCAPGGVGAPALVNYCREACEETPQVQWDLWADASEVERSDESFRFIDFGVCGWASEQPQLPSTEAEWIARPRASAPFLWTIPPSAREPTLLPIEQHGADPRVERVVFAFAQRVGPATAERYAIYGGAMFPNPGDGPGARTLLLDPEQAPGCVSVRDPLLAADWVPDGDGFSVGGAWLLFTCERADGAPRTIGIARLTLGSAPALDRSFPVRADVLTAGIGRYAERGVFAPEGFVEPSGADRIARIWFLARDGRGRVRLAYAQGRGPDEGGFPALVPYAANPILDGDSDVLGDDCSAGCTLTGLSVTPSFIELGNYQFLIARSRLTPTGRAHDLVPLLQPAPDDR